MPYKIVQTRERGRPCLCIVPSYWEYRGELSWPPKNKPVTKIIKDGDSRPESDWLKMECQVKRRNLNTLAQAEDELKSMQENSDTDCNIGSCDPMLQSVSLSTNDIVLPSTNQMEFDAMAETLANEANNPQPMLDNNVTDTPADETTYHVCANENLNTVILSNQNIISEKLDTMMSIIQNQNKIIDNMVRKIAFMSVQLEELNNKQYAGDEQPMTVTALKDARDNESFSFTIIENELQLKALETTISDKEQYKKIKKNLSFLCSPTVGNGISCAYKLLDTIFSRNFVCDCSWSGGSRGNVAKVPLKNYKFFQKFFFDMIHMWDSSFTKEECEKFFKTVLKNATKRKAMKNLRTSAKRSRKTKTVKKQHAKEIDVPQQVSVGTLDGAGTSNKYEQSENSIAKDNDKENEDEESLL